MLVCPSRAYIFIHVQKTAGSSIDAALRRVSPRAVSHFPDLSACRDPMKNKHLFACDLKQYLGDELWHSYYKFAFVRNPWSRLVSWYTMCVERPSTPFMWFVKENASCFEEFLHLTYGRAKKTTFNQIDYISDENGQVIVDYVGRFETLKEDFAHICKQLQVSVELPHKNRGRGSDYREMYTEETKALVADRFARDVKAFGYKFE